MKITKVRAVPYDKLQTTTPGWKNFHRNSQTSR
jgi:hypothetical protein